MEYLYRNYPELEVCKADIQAALEIVVNCYKSGGKVLTCGNGGSAADAEHIVGELMKGFMLRRGICEDDKEKIRSAFPNERESLADGLQGALPAISLTSQTALNTAFINDVNHEMFFAQQVYGYGKQGDVLIALSTSGNSVNVVNAVKIAKVFGLETVGMTGIDGGEIARLCDITVKVPAKETYRVQELHLPVYHAVCTALEQEFFG